jgi:hypothetical protein
VTRFDEAQLRRYRERHPHLFGLAELSKPKPVRQAPNGYPNEAAFQVAAKAELEALGWHVQESLKGSARGGSVLYGAGGPDLQVYRPVRRVWFIELKQPGNKPSDAQLACHARLRVCGFRVVVAYRLSEILDIEGEQRL